MVKLERVLTSNIYYIFQALLNFVFKFKKLYQDKA